MSGWSVKRLLRPVPQPYKAWIARALIVPYVIVLLPFAIVVEGTKWIAASGIPGNALFLLDGEGRRL